MYSGIDTGILNRLRAKKPILILAGCCITGINIGRCRNGKESDNFTCISKSFIDVGNGWNLNYFYSS